VFWSVLTYVGVGALGIASIAAAIGSVVWVLNGTARPIQLVWLPVGLVGITFALTWVLERGVFSDLEVDACYKTGYDSAAGRMTYTEFECPEGESDEAS